MNFKLKSLAALWLGSHDSEYSHLRPEAHWQAQLVPGPLPVYYSECQWHWQPEVVLLVKSLFSLAVSLSPSLLSESPSLSLAGSDSESESLRVSLSLSLSKLLQYASASLLVVLLVLLLVVLVLCYY